MSSDGVFMAKISLWQISGLCACASAEISDLLRSKNIRYVASPAGPPSDRYRKIVPVVRLLMTITYMRLLIFSKKNEVLALQLNESGLEFMIVTAIDGVEDKNIITPVLTYENEKYVKIVKMKETSCFSYPHCSPMALCPVNLFTAIEGRDMCTTVQCKRIHNICSYNHCIPAKPSAEFRYITSIVTTLLTYARILSICVYVFHIAPASSQ